MLTTYNRSTILHETLAAFEQLDTSDLQVEFVVVNNNSSDRTDDVLATFRDRLPLVTFFEPRPGKNCALNLALDQHPLGKLVVFTDDDVTPRPDWLQQVAAAAYRWPDYAVFGGKVDVRWPVSHVPAWAEIPWIREMSFAAHDFGPTDTPYEGLNYPYGANYWVRSLVFQHGRRFNEAVGPRPKNRIMGSESSFLAGLAHNDYAMMYIGESIVEHRIAPSEVSVKSLCKRAVRFGRGNVHVRGIPERDRLARSPLRWYLRHSSRLGYGCLRYLAAHCLRDENRRAEAFARAAHLIGYEREALGLAWNGRASTGSPAVPDPR